MDRATSPRSVTSAGRPPPIIGASRPGVCRPARALALALAATACWSTACSSPAPDPTPAPYPAPAAPTATPSAATPSAATPSTATPSTATRAGAASAGGCPSRLELGPGLVAERIRFADREGCLTVVRIDPARHALRVHTAAADGRARAAPRWAADFGLSAVINTSMFHDDHRSIGLLRDARAVHSDVDNPKLGGFFAFDPVDPADPPVAVAGRDCPGFDLAALRRRYRGLIQNYRMLDCDGRPLRWADPKLFSAAAIGLDGRGQVVFLHSRTPFRMTELNRFIARPEIGLAAALYVEGGPEASLYAAGPGGRVEEIGSFETDFHDDSNRAFWPIPNVLGAVPVPAR
jgi:hypothetical protein